MVTGGGDPVQANSEAIDSSFQISLEFEMPNDIPPRTQGGGVRGQVNFAPPGDAAPQNTNSGGVRGDVTFAPPGEEAPQNTNSGGVRGEVNFAPPGEEAPNNTSSAGVRGDVNFATPGEARPSRVVGAGVRGDVNANEPGNDASNSGFVEDKLLTIVPLMPTTNYGRTISSRPTFLVYMPPTASKEVFFSLQDANRNHHYQTKFQISGQGGIVALTLPDEAPELEMGKEYVWFLAPIEPNGILRPDNYGVNGWVKRVDSPIESQELSSSNPIELATLYAKEGIWYDTLQVLSAAKLAQPDDSTLASEWKDLLEQVKLEAIANEQILEQL